MLKRQGDGRTVADLARPEVLDWARIYEAGLACPLVALADEVLVWSAVQLDESLLDDRLHLAGTLLHVHHHGDRNTTGNPFVNRLEGVLDR